MRIVRARRGGVTPGGRDEDRLYMKTVWIRKSAGGSSTVAVHLTICIKLPIKPDIPSVLLQFSWENPEVR